MARLAAAYEVLKQGTLWSSRGRCKGFAVANPGEAARIDAYVAALDRGEKVDPPTLSTATGLGLVTMLDALADQIEVLPPDPPDPPNPPVVSVLEPGVSFGGIGYTDDAAKRGRMMDDVIAMGGKTLRMQWWRQSQCTDAIKQAQQKGLKVFTCFMPDYADTVIDRSKAYSYGQEAARLLAPLGVRDIEFWNEPDLTSTWTPELWAQAALGFYEGVMSVDSSLRVWQGALWTWKMNSGSTTEGAFAWWKRAYAEWNRLGVQHLPGYGCSGHMYGDMLWDNPRNALYGYFGPDGTGKATNCIRYLMDQNGDKDKPIICTEGGHGVPSSQPSSVNALFDLTASGILQTPLVYSQWDDAAGTFGMRPAEGQSQRPAYDIFKTRVGAGVSATSELRSAPRADYAEYEMAEPPKSPYEIRGEAR